MSADHLTRLAKQRIVKLSADIEVQLSDKRGGAVAIEILRRLHDRAAESLAALIICDATDPKAVLILQNEVKRYDEWLGWLREIVTEGVAYDKAFTDEDREEMLDFLAQRPDGERTAQALGLVDAQPVDA